MNPALSNHKNFSHARKGGVKKPMRILVTAGPTREFIDPVRFISNLSTGSMGYAISGEAARRNHKVTLISGPVDITPPKNIKTINVITAQQMFAAVKAEFKNSDCLIMSAAVADFSPRKTLTNKMKKKTLPRQYILQLKQNPDILKWAGGRKAARLIIGFCMESEALIKNAKDKLKNKRADIVVANKINKNTSAFGRGLTKVSILQKNGHMLNIGPSKKAKIADILLDKIEALWYKNFNAAA